jgi:hypothetical protein
MKISQLCMIPSVTWGNCFRANIPYIRLGRWHVAKGVKNAIAVIKMDEAAVSSSEESSSGEEETTDDSETENCSE